MKRCPKYCVVTMIFNNYEPIREPLEVSENADYICFTDNKDLKSDKWKVIYLEEFDTDEMNGVQKTFRVKHQLYKYIPNLEKYEYVFRIDGSMQILTSLDSIIQYLLKYNYDLAVPHHPHRDNTIDEYFAWIGWRGISANHLKTFILNTSKYYDYHIKGLFEGGCWILRNTNNVWNLMDDIYRYIEQSTQCSIGNDQCYATYVLYQHLNNINLCIYNPLLYRGNDKVHSKFLMYCEHNKPSRAIEGDGSINNWKSKRTIEVFDRIFILPTINFEH